MKIFQGLVIIGINASLCSKSNYKALNYLALGLRFVQGKKVRLYLRSVRSMEYIEKVLEKIKEWTRKLIEALLGPDIQPDSEPIPIPVRDSDRY